MARRAENSCGTATQPSIKAYWLEALNNIRLGVGRETQWVLHWADNLIICLSVFMGTMKSSFSPVST